MSTRRRGLIILCVIAILLATVWVMFGGIAHATDTRVTDATAGSTR